MSSSPRKSDPLFVSSAHIGRAKREFRWLKAGVNGFIESRPYTVDHRRDESGIHIVACRKRDLPEDLGWGATCVIERLRSALDAAVFKLVEANGRGTSGVGFPFGGMDGNTGKPRDFPDDRMTGKGGIKTKLTPEQWEFIEAQRPFPGGTDLIWGINEVANAIKHRAVLIEAVPDLAQSTSFGAGPSAGFSKGGSSIVRPKDRDFNLRDRERETVLLFSDGRGFNERIKLEVTPRVVFSDIHPVSGKEILRTLNRQIRMTETVVGGLRNLIQL